MTRTLRPLAALAMLALIVSSCSNADTAGSARTGGNSNATARDKAMKFSECMRDNGVSDFPDLNASGGFTIEDIANGSSVDTSSVAFTRALAACKDLEPPGFTGDKRSPAQQAAALEFAECIRENGVKDFPDPGPDAPLVDTNRIPSSNTQAGMTILNAAMQKCGSYASAAGVQGP